MIWGLSNAAAQSPYLYYKEKVDSLRKKHRKGSSISDKSSLQKIKELRDTTVQLEYYDLAGATSIIIGKLNQQLGMMSAAERAYKEAISYGQKVDDSLWLAKAWEQLGDFYSLENRNFLSLESHFKALALNEKYDNTKMSISGNYNSIAKAYIQAGELGTAESYLNKSFILKKSLNDTLRMGVITTLYAEIFRLRKEYEKAAAYFLMDIPKRKSQKNFEGLVFSYLGLGDTYFDWGKYDKAEEAYREALAAADTIQRYRNMGLALLKLGNVYQQTKEYQKSKESYFKAIEVCTQVDSRVYLINAYQAMYLLNKKEGNIKDAMENLEKYIEIYKINVAETQDIKLDDLKASYQLKEKEHELASLDLENKKSKQLQRILLAGILLLVLLSAFLILLYRSRNQALQILHAEQVKMQTLLTEKEVLLENLQQTHHQLVHSEKMASLGVMTAGIAHEINNPVSSIHASVEALQMDMNEAKPILDFLTSIVDKSVEDIDISILQKLLSNIDITYLSIELQVLLQTILKSSQRTSEIIQGLKTFSRESNDTKIAYEIEEGIDAALTILHHKMHKNIVVNKHYGFGSDIVCQPSKINQVFLNILDNAIQSLRDGGIITIETKRMGQFCHIIITDNGDGMDENTQKKAFEPFYTTKDIGQGTGLGLSISYAIMEAHKGTIDIISQVGKGSTFIIKLPVF